MNTDKIQDIIRVFEESGLHKMELEVDDMKIKMEKGAAADGIVQEILITNEAMVEFDQELIRIGEAA